MPSKHELVEAITVLKEECYSHDSCGDCPFCDGNIGCMIQRIEPFYWSVGMMKEDERK